MTSESAETGERLLGDGVWCRACEFLETGDEVDPTAPGMRCLGCGCDSAEHVYAVVLQGAPGQEDLLPDPPGSAGGPT